MNTKAFLLKLPPILFLLILTAAPAARAQDGAFAPGQPQALVITDPQQMILDELHDRLASFARQWIATLKRNQLSGPGNCEVQRAADGRYVARYNAIRDDDAPICQVRASTYKPGAYIGSILYKVEVFESYGDTPQAAKAGPFQAASRTTLNEIFSIANKDAAWSAPR